MPVQVRFQTIAAMAVCLGLAACASKPKLAPAPAVAEPARPAPEPSAPPSLGESPAQLSLQQDLAQTAGDRVFFAVDSATLSEDARQGLAAQAQWLARHPDVRVLVAGNCDERGTREYNLALGARRASVARDFLVAQGVANARIQTVSYGKERPIDAGNGESAWARNRNASTVIIDLAPR